MAIRYAITNGNWSNATTWNGSTLPDLFDDVYADGKTVGIDQDVVVASISTSIRPGGTAGGVFSCLTGCTVTANIIAGSVNCLNTNHAGNMNIVGNVFGGGGYGVGITNASSGSIHITGSIYGGSNYYSYGLTNSSTGNIYVAGNIYAGGSAGPNVYGLLNSSTGNLYIVGNAIASNYAYAIYCSSTGLVDITGDTASSSYYPACYGLNASFIIRGNLSGRDGIFPVVCSKLRVDNTIPQRIITQKVNNTDKYFYNAGIEIGNPPVTDVRKQVVYGPNNELSGIMEVPPKNTVVAGVPVDNEVGTWAFTEELIARMQNCSTVESVGEQLRALTN